MPIEDDLKKEIKKLKQRNKKVEADKDWELSLFRKLLILILTYLVIAIFFLFAKIEKPFLNAIVPSLAFLLSTLTMPFFKKFWLKNIKK